MYTRTTVDKWRYDALKVLLVVVVLAALPNIVKKAFSVEPLLWPTPEYDPIVIKEKVLVEIPLENIDTWIDKYATKYATSKKPVSYLKYQLHCLANKESGHRYNNHKHCGDSGKSCGLYQYRQATWRLFRVKMGKPIGSLWNNEQAVETTAWALSHNYDNHWGPWRRGGCH